MPLPSFTSAPTRPAAPLERTAVLLKMASGAEALLAVDRVTVMVRIPPFKLIGLLNVTEPCPLAAPKSSCKPSPTKPVAVVVLPPAKYPILVLPLRLPPQLATKVLSLFRVTETLLALKEAKPPLP